MASSLSLSHYFNPISDTPFFSTKLHFSFFFILPSFFSNLRNYGSIYEDGACGFTITMKSYLFSLLVRNDFFFFLVSFLGFDPYCTRYGASRSGGDDHRVAARWC